MSRLLTAAMLALLGACQCTQVNDGACFVDTCDAVSRDGGSAIADAGTPDSGSQNVDSGVADAGQVDAGGDFDGGATDDAGTNDAGRPGFDAGMRDAGSGLLVVVRPTQLDCVALELTSTAPLPIFSPIRVTVRAADAGTRYALPICPTFPDQWLSGVQVTTAVIAPYFGAAVFEVEVGGITGQSATYPLTATQCDAVLSHYVPDDCVVFDAHVYRNMMPLTLLNTESCTPTELMSCGPCRLPAGSTGGALQFSAPLPRTLGVLRLSPSGMACTINP